VALCAEAGAPLTCIGKGFNTLVSDRGVRGVVVSLADLRSVERDAQDHVHAEAGATHSAVTRFCADQALAGLEFAVGIPGTVGGWLAMNAGIPEREMKDVAHSVSYVDVQTAELMTKPAAELRWHYRRLELPAAALIVASRFATTPGDRDDIRARMREHLDYRRQTQPVNEPSCGSVFKNPPNDRAGRLIEAAGLKGLQQGAAEISSLHANFIVTREGASAADVRALIERARSAVAERFGIELETEVHMLGEDAP